MTDAPELLDARIQRAVDAHGARTAVVEPDGRSLTYAELWRRAGAVASWLAQRGVGREDRVALILPKSADAVAAVLGVLRAGAAYLPIDASSPPARARRILRDGDVSAVLANPDAAALVAEACPDAPVLITPGQPWLEVLRAGIPPPDRAGRGPRDLAYVLYTSGSTGAPKGVMLTHRNALAFVDWAVETYEPAPGDRASSHAPLHFDLSIFDLFVNLAGGSEVHLIGEAAGKNPRALSALIAERRLHRWYSTPSVLGLVTAFGGMDAHAYPELRQVLFAGEVFPLPALRRLAAHLPHASFFNLYGPTETNVCTAAPAPLPLASDRSAPIAIGRPCAGYRAVLLDASGGNAVPDGEPGLLHVSGPGLFRGYWNADALTAERCFLRPGADGEDERWYDTGDVARWDSAEGLHFLGRRDRMVKRRGHRVELGEVEAGLHDHPHVRSVAVVAVTGADGGVKLRAHLVTRDGKPLSLLAVKTFCAAALPSAMVPDEFVFESELPMTPTDKVDYRALSEG